MKVQVIPGILEQEEKEFEAKMLLTEKFADRVFVDIIDGKFAPNMTIGMDELLKKPAHLVTYVHLMVDEPISYLNQCSEAEVEMAVGQVELMEDQLEFVDKGLMLGLKVGLALDLETPTSFIEPDALEKSSSVLLLSVEAGFSEQKFDEKILGKIKELRDDGFKGDIFIDGGVNKETIKACTKAGANGLSVTSGIWKSKNPAKTYRELVELANS